MDDGKWILIVLAVGVTAWLAGGHSARSDAAQSYEQMFRYADLPPECERRFESAVDTLNREAEAISEATPAFPW